MTELLIHMSKSLIILSEDGFAARLWVLNKLLAKKPNKQQQNPPPKKQQ